MNPLPDRLVLIGLLVTVGLCFALVLWSVKLQPRPDAPLQWRDAPTVRAPGSSGSLARLSL
jgi:hypothetical protein